MNRDKFVNDESYREGYLDGRKEGATAVIIALYVWIVLKERSTILNKGVMR